MESDDVFLKKMGSSMFVKFEKYWSTFSTIMAIAIVFYPRYKLNVIDWAYKKIYDESYTLELDIFKDKLFDLYNEYASLDAASSTSSTNNSNSSTTSVDVSSDEFMMDYDSYAANTFTSVAKSELELYLAEPTLPRSADISILDYWMTNSARYPVVSQMARDILAIAISTVFSESTFSISGEILDPYRSSLKPSTIEALVCLRDWSFNQGLKQTNIEELCGQITMLNVGEESSFDQSGK